LLGSTEVIERRLADHPFGTYALQGGQASLRRWANALSDSMTNRWIMSLIRKRLLAGRDEPVDADVFETMHARLYPRTNRCEKRMFVGETTWDAPERAAIAQALAKPSDRPFVFVDGGANVGMYSLFVIALSRRLGRAIKVLAIEPDPTNLGRLKDNLAASAGHEAKVAEVALGAEKGRVRLASDQTNRGEVRISADGGVEVALAPLLDVLKGAGLEHVDVLKLDVEGHELPILSAFFATASRPLWPRMILLEIGHDGDTAALAACLAAGYRIGRRMRINALLELAA